MAAGRILRVWPPPPQPSPASGRGSRRHPVRAASLSLYVILILLHRLVSAVRHASQRNPLSRLRGRVGVGATRNGTPTVAPRVSNHEAIGCAIQSTWKMLWQLAGNRNHESR